ncbi:MAG: IclR family transcriptional regulator [Caulobacteraceae bacterium]
MSSETDLEAVGTERRYRAPALEKGLDILELLASNGAAMTPSQISSALDRSMSELFRMIQVLEYKGYIAPADSGDGYELSNKLFTLSMSRAPVRTLLEVALPVMRQLSDVIGQSCHLAVPSEDQMVVIARIENPGYLGFSVRPGYRRCLTESSSGVTLFAFQPRAVQAAWSARLAVGKPDAMAAFRKRADTVRSRGHEQAASDFVQGVTDISCPIMTGEAAVAALTVPYLRSASSPVDIDVVVDKLKAAVAGIAEDVVATL